MTRQGSNAPPARRGKETPPVSPEIQNILIFLLIGGVAGWLAGLVIKGFGFGLVGNIVVGILGAVIAGFLFPALGVSLGSGIVAAILHATIGAVILLLVLRVVKRA